MQATKISVHEVKAKLDRGEPFVFLDSRSPKAWGESHEKMPGALRVPADEVERHLGEVPRDRPIITYCT
jgi:rhodanese-related sulfurtransferase